MYMRRTNKFIHMVVPPTMNIDRMGKGMSDKEGSRVQGILFQTVSVTGILSGHFHESGPPV